MPLPSGYHCYYRPARSKPRTYSAADAARIARYAARDQGPGRVAAAILDEFGYLNAICKIYSVLDQIDDIQERLVVAKVLAILSGILGAIIRILSAGSKVVKQLLYAVAILGTIQLLLTALSAALREISVSRLVLGPICESEN
jgi:hypothetical protein